MELTRAYAILGVGDEASLEDVRTAFHTWWGLYSGAPLSDAPEAGHALNTEGWDDPAAMLALHELDMAWHAIEQAHLRRVAREARTPGCDDCGAGPAVRVTLTRTKPGGLRARTETTSAVLCRACGLEAFHEIQGSSLRTGWWGMAAPFRNAKVVKANAAEAKLLRQIDLPVIAPRAGGPAAGLTEPPVYRPPLTRRMAPWLTGVAAVLIVLGISMPASSGGPPPPADGAQNSAAASP